MVLIYGSFFGLFRALLEWVYDRLDDDGDFQRGLDHGGIRLHPRSSRYMYGLLCRRQLRQ